MHTFKATYTLKTIDAVAAEIVPHLHAKCVLFNGNMGAGKTTLVQALLKALKSNDIATSPTFSIVNEYGLPNDKVFHFDFYRIESLEEALDFGIEDYFNSPHWLFIEWAEIVASFLTENKV